MNPSHDFPSGLANEDAAIAWLAERADGFSPAREREFAQWLRADPRHAAAITRLEQTLGLLGEMPAYRAELNTTFGRAAPVVPFPPSGAVAAPRMVRPVRRWSRALAWGGVAAALAIGALAGWQELRPPAETRYVTSVAGYERARLDDGSTLELNAATAVRVQFTPAVRSVKLEAGEAHFAVAHDAARPFVVSAGNVAVRAVGTAFNVRYAADGGVEVIVTEGKVSIGPALAAGRARPKPDHRDSANGTPPSGGPTFLSAGERLHIPNQAPVPIVERVDPAALRAALAWQSRLADFAEAPLADVIARFNARSRVQLILADEKLADRRIGGTFALDEAEAFVRLLERDGEIIGERRGESEILLRRTR
ncbi:MAG: FecR domain-containing protein [Opitutaceae bacterium]|nr:FecR domain-containing protein [Opitutaceae bacterium]